MVHDTILITSCELLINSSTAGLQSLPITALHFNIQTKTPQEVTPLRMLQECFFQVHVSSFNQHVSHARILDACIFLEFSSNGLHCFLLRNINVIDCENARYFSVMDVCLFVCLFVWMIEWVRLRVRSCGRFDSLYCSALQYSTA